MKGKNVCGLWVGAILVLSIAVLSASAYQVTLTQLANTSGFVNKSGLSTYGNGTGYSNVMVELGVTRTRYGFEAFGTWDLPPHANVTLVEVQRVDALGQPVSKCTNVAMYFGSWYNGLFANAATYSGGTTLVIDIISGHAPNDWIDLSENGVDATLLLNKSGPSEVKLVPLAPPGCGYAFNGRGPMNMRVTYELPPINVSIISPLNATAFVNDSNITFRANFTTAENFTNYSLFMNYSGSVAEIFVNATLPNGNFTAIANLTNMSAGWYSYYFQGCSKWQCNTSQTRNINVTSPSKVTTGIVGVEDNYQATNATPTTFSCNATSEITNLTSIELWSTYSGSLALWDTLAATGSFFIANWTKTNFVPGLYYWECKGYTASNQSATEQRFMNLIEQTMTSPVAAWVKPLPVFANSTVACMANFSNLTLVKNYSVSLLTNVSGITSVAQTFNGNQTFALSFEDTNRTNDNEAPISSTGGYSYVQGKVGKGLFMNMDGMSNYHYINYSIVGNAKNNTGSVSFWMNQTLPAGTYPDARSIVSIQSDYLHPKVQVGMSWWDNNQYAFTLWAPVQNFYQTKLNWNTWYYITLSWNSTNFTLNINGTEVYSKKSWQVDLNDSIMNSTIIMIGDMQGPEIYYTLDELSIVNYKKPAIQSLWEYSNPGMAYPIDVAFNSTDLSGASSVMCQFTVYDNNSINPNYVNSSWYPINITAFPAGSVLPIGGVVNLLNFYSLPDAEPISLLGRFDGVVAGC